MAEKYVTVGATAGGDGSLTAPWDGMNDITWGTSVDDGDVLTMDGAFTVLGSTTGIRSIGQTYVDWVTVQGGSLIQAETPAYSFNVQWQDNDYLRLQDMAIGSATARSVYIRATTANVAHIHLRGLSVDNSRATIAAGHAIWVLDENGYAVSNVTISYVDVTGTSSGSNSDGINAQVGTNLDISDCVLTGTEAEGIDISGGTAGVTVRRIKGINVGRSVVKLHAQKRALDGVELVSVASSSGNQNYSNYGLLVQDVEASTIAQCSIYNPGGGPLSALGLDTVNPGNSAFTGNLFHNNILVADYASGVTRLQSTHASGPDAALTVFEGAHTWTHNCMWQSGAQTRLIHFDDDTGNHVTEANHSTFVSSHAGEINSDPLFIDAANNDLRLHGDSPCIGAGTKWWADGNVPIGEDGLRHYDIPEMGAYALRSGGKKYMRKAALPPARMLPAGYDISKVRAA